MSGSVKCPITSLGYLPSGLASTVPSFALSDWVSDLPNTRLWCPPLVHPLGGLPSHGTLAPSMVIMPVPHSSEFCFMVPVNGFCATTMGSCAGFNLLVLAILVVTIQLIMSMILKPARSIFIAILWYSSGEQNERQNAPGLSTLRTSCQVSVVGTDPSHSSMPMP